MRTLFFSLLLCCSLMAQDQGTRYKIAIVGLVHSHVWGHLTTMLQSKTTELVGVAEPNPELVNEAKKAGVDEKLFFADYNDMLRRTKPDIVWAFVENNRHLEIAKVCAPLHVNLIFEKPLASSYGEARQMRDLASRYNVRIMTNYQMAWWPSNYVAKAAVDRGEIGTVYRLHGIVGHGGPGSEGPRNKYFFAWLTDPVKNGAGALMDFGCYNALWALWYMGVPETVFATVNHLRPDRFPKVEDNAALVLTYKNGVGLFEGSWDLPRSLQDLEVFGKPNGHDPGSVYMSHEKVELQKGKEKRTLPQNPLPAGEDEPVAYMVSRIKANKPIEGLTAIDINARVINIIDLAKESVKTGKAVRYRE